MDEQSELKRIARSVSRLTVAVWCLVAIYLLQALAWIVPMMAPNFYAMHVASPTGVSKELFESWDGLSLEDKLARSSIVLITEYKNEDGRLKAIIKEILKQVPGTSFHYKLGEEYRPLSQVPKDNTSYGEGCLVLLQGSPATNRESYSIFNGSISAEGNMPVDKIRAMIGAKK